MIRKISLSDDFIELALLLNESFLTVAEEFGLTVENCPTNNAFITPDNLKSQLTNTREFYGYFVEENVKGFIALEKSLREEGTFYIEKLAVHPFVRHKRIGHILMEYASDRIKELAGKKISIGVIEENTRLKKWYETIGFKQVGVKAYDHLPFNVCFMEKSLI